MASKGKRNVEMMVEAIRESIAEGKPALPWHKPWSLVGHKSVKTGHVYQGGNGFFAAIVADVKGFGPAWGTFKQLVGVTGKGDKAVPGVLRGMGGTLRGQSGIGLWRPIFKKEQNDAGKMVQTLIGFRDFVAFNVDQVTYDDRGESAHKVEHRLGRIRLDAAKAELSKTTVREARPMDEIDAALAPFEASLLGGIEFTSTGNSASYSPLADRVRMPKQDRFETDAAFYSTRFHEDAHATGGKGRLNRFKVEDFGSRDRYSYEELVAEMAAAYLRAEFGVEGGTEEEMSAAYVQTWAERISDLDDKTLYKAMGQAVKAAEWVLLGDPALRAKDDEKAAPKAGEPEVASATS